MKHYIFLSYITGSGGVQCYLAAKAKFLEEQGWHVLVFSSNDPKSKEKCKIDYLNKFLRYGNPFFDLHPCNVPRFIVKQSLKQCIIAIGPISEGEEVIVESWNSPTALWGELLASHIHGRHVFFAANEYYRGNGTLYEEKIGFYEFKMDRGEMFASIQCANRLFEGYREYKTGDFVEVLITEDPVQDISCKQLELLEKQDYNICYIGRSLKPYVPSIYKGVEEFAKAHSDKRMSFIIVGELLGNRKELLPSNLPNLKIIELGDLFPLPRVLYKKVDVVIAGSGSARHSADEGALVITADAETSLSHGLLGYDTNESVYSETGDKEVLNMSFYDALERALVRQEWRSQQNKWIRSPGIADSVERQLEMLLSMSAQKEYYSSKELLEGRLRLKPVLMIGLKDLIYRMINVFR